MTSRLKPTSISEDVWIHHPRGRIFARIWTPSTDQRQSPIVLFHDSVGCVELWRGFPAALSTGTQGRVIAYDRLGFGHSAARRDKAAHRFRCG